MALPAMKREPEVLVEENIARLESDVAHIRSDMSEMKVDIRELRHDAKRLDDKIDKVDRRVSDLTLSVEKTFTKLSLWALMLYILLAAGMLSVIARAFKWV